MLVQREGATMLAVFRLIRAKTWFKFGNKKWALFLTDLIRALISHFQTIRKIL